MRLRRAPLLRKGAGRKVIGLLVMVAGAGLVFRTTPVWFWLVVVGGILIGLGWAVFDHED